MHLVFRRYYSAALWSGLDVSLVAGLTKPPSALTGAPHGTAGREQAGQAGLFA